MEGMKKPLNRQAIRKRTALFFYVSKMTRSTSALAILLFAAFLAAPRSWAGPLPGMRAPNSYEIFYHYVAVNVDAPEICRKISPKAYLTAAWGGQGTQISLTRSECYYDVATRFARQDLCANVVPISTVFLNGSHYSPGYCRSKIAKYGPDVSLDLALPDDKVLVRIFSQMGYDPATVISQHLTPDPLNLFDVYAQLGKKSDILKRINRLLGSPRIHDIPVEQREMLYDLAGHVTNDIRWCQKIRTDALSPDSRYFKNTSHEYFRDTCILQVAYNTKRVSLCAAMPDRPPDKDHIIPEKRTCSLQLAHPQYIFAHYRYLIPRDEQVIANLLKALNYPLPNWSNASSREILDVYHRFLLALTKYPDNMFKKKENSFYNEAREDFIRRVKTLLDFQ